MMYSRQIFIISLLISLLYGQEERIITSENEAISIICSRPSYNHPTTTKCSCDRDKVIMVYVLRTICFLLCS